MTQSSENNEDKTKTASDIKKLQSEAHTPKMNVLKFNMAKNLYLTIRITAKPFLTIIRLAVSFANLRQMWVQNYAPEKF